MAKGPTIRMWQRSLILLTVLVIAGFGLLIVRLFNIHIIDGEKLQRDAINQQLNDTSINAKRGTIYDCNMKPLAQSATVWTVVLEPAYIDSEEKKQTIVDGLSPILSMDAEELSNKISKNSKSYYYIVKRKVETDIKDKIVEFKSTNNITNGIRLIEDYKRYYPYGAFASSVLGFTGNESQGLAGIENYYDEYLTGTAGRIVTARNAVGTDMPFDYEQMLPATDGYNLVLSIDEVIQHFLEKSLEEGLINNKVQNRGTAIIMDVNTGAILGMAVKGDFDPNNPFKIADEEKKNEIEALPEDQKEAATSEALQQQWRNKAVSDTYYPGSVFKMVTASMCLQENIYNEESPFYCSGSINVAGSNINCHLTSGHGAETFVRALCNSCNPAFATMGLTLGAEKFYQYYTAFGFADKTGIDLPGESDDIFFSKDGSMSITDLAVASFGQNFSITPIQMLTAAATVANGGKLVQPHVVNKIVDSDNNVIKSFDNNVKRQVISEDVSRRMCAILQQNAIDGSGKNGYIEGYRIAGKTGTSEKIADYVKTGVKTYIASYCGFAPADDPQIAMLVFYDNPQGSSYYGAMVAAPTFKSVMENVLPYIGVEPKYTDEEAKKLNVKTPFLIGQTVEEAKNLLAQSQLTANVYGSGENVIGQVPQPDQQIPQNGTVVLYTDTVEMQSESKVTVPKLIGLRLSEVNNVAQNAGINISVTGVTSDSADVLSTSQSIPEGSQVNPGTVVSVNFAKNDGVL